MTTITRTLEAEIHDWIFERWPNPTLAEIAAKLAEECGEVCGAILKMHEQRTTPQDVLDELGDVLVVASSIAAYYHTTVDQVRANRWEQVSRRHTPKGQT